jgi:hypothetical protein
VKKGTTYTEPSTVAPYIGSSDGGWSLFSPCSVYWYLLG